MKIIQNTLKIEKNLRCMKNILSRPLVGFLETRPFICQIMYYVCTTIFSAILLMMAALLP